ncbi:biopolymer transporter ExbD [Rasiella rasia]|uniref:Biopolymer transporter ExbD n=1 Tax=Rasiella rasia TaxID=2744027 RepID=A0A6G6GIU2_9FLAO|nr:biopolymer transporter ExbD [Rasiella rasia]QIE58434.1 biopolymer transporter ExbD [Rasiella rasia]
MKSSRTMATINAGSMADIAFLLLLFFLVSTTISQEKGIVRKLPERCLTDDCTAHVAERNILRITLNEEGTLMVQNEILPISQLKNVVQLFIDNNGSNSCLYCTGAKDVASSDHPSKAVISISTHRLAPYKSYIAIQDELTLAYKELRTRYAETTFNKAITTLTTLEEKETQKAYPFTVSEITLKK